MNFSIEHKNIKNFLLENKKEDFSIGFCKILESSDRIEKRDIKILSKFVKLNELDNLCSKLLELFVRFKIKISLSSTSRVYKHRELLKAKGYKRVSFELPPDTYEKFKQMKLEKNMTYSEFIVFLIELK